MIGWIILALLLVIALAAPRYGADSRVADSWTMGAAPVPVRRGPTVHGDLRAVTRALARGVGGRH